jgi:Zn-finger nucleic acid-binding protein
MYETIQSVVSNPGQMTGMSTRTAAVRNCPVCKAGLRAIYVDDVTIDFCPNCRGSWFELDELQGVYERRDSVAELLLPALPHLPRDPVLCTHCGNHNSRLEKACTNCKVPVEFLCPGCGKQLEATERQGLNVDCCRSCKGVWLDGGELTLLFEHYSRTIQNRRTDGSSDAAVVGAAAAADLALDMFIWAPDLYIAATAQVLTHLPELASKGLDMAGDMPEIAGQAAEGLIRAAGSANDLAASAISGAAEAAGAIGGAASEAAASFIELILDLVSGIFD